MSEKKQYTAPALTVLGTVADLTRGGAGTQADGNFTTRQGGQ